MPKLGMEPIRRAALVKATIDEIGELGSLDVTVSRIAKRAGMSSALAHHYFGSKDEIFLAAMRHILTVYGQEVRAALAAARGPEARLRAIIGAGFGPSNFHPAATSAWLNFWVMAQRNAGAARLLRVYEGRLRSNLRFNLRSLAPGGAAPAAERIAAMIDGVYLRQAARMTPSDGAEAARMALQVLDYELAALRPDPAP